MENTDSQKPKDNSGVVSVQFADKNDLYGAYMPFIKNGALFVQTKKSYSLGEEVFLLIRLLEEPEKFSVAGKVVWITPPCAQGGRKAGIGVQFVSDNAAQLRNKIETTLAGMLQSDRATDTL